MSLPSPRVAIVAYGEILSYSETKKLLSKFDQVVAVDGGLAHCDQMNITPIFIIGDFDSVTPELLNKYSQVPKIKFPVDKDHSDLELGLLELFKRGENSIALFGVLGKRVDHLLYTMNLLARYPTKLIVQSENETIFCLQNRQEIAVEPGQTISLIPLSPVTGVNTVGLKWEISNGTFNKEFMSLSNICLEDSFSVSFLSGDLLCCLQNPPHHKK